TAEDFLAHHHAEGNTQRCLPQGQIRRNDQGEEHGCDEEAFVDLVAALDGEEHFPEAADDEGHRVDRQEEGRTMPEAVPDAVRVIAGEHLDHCAVPALDTAGAGGGEDGVGLPAHVVHAVEHGREGADPHGDHDALEVDAVAHMGGAAGYAAGLIENRINRFVQGVPAVVFAAFMEVRLQLVEQITYGFHGLALPLDSGEIFPQDRAVFVLAGAYKGT